MRVSSSVLFLCVFLVFLVGALAEGQCTAPPAPSSSESSSSTTGEKCSSCSCSGGDESGLPTLPVLSSNDPHYGLLLSYDIESCKIKEQHTAMMFLARARDYHNYLRVRFMSVDSDGTPRILIFPTEADRDLAIVDSDNLTEEQIKAYLLGTAPPPPNPLYQFNLTHVSLVDIENVLEYFHVPKGFPVSHYPDEAAQGDLWH